MFDPEKYLQGANSFDPENYLKGSVNKAISDPVSINKHDFEKELEIPSFTNKDIREVFPDSPNKTIGRIVKGKRVKEYGMRREGTAKGAGYFGEIKNEDGTFSTELSINVDGREIPTLVPTLTDEEIRKLQVGGEIPQTIVDKAVKHAETREAQGKSPFADVNEQSPRNRRFNKAQQRYLEWLKPRSNKLYLQAKGLGYVADTADYEMSEIKPEDTNWGEDIINSLSRNTQDLAVNFYGNPMFKAFQGSDVKDEMKLGRQYRKEENIKYSTSGNGWVKDTITETIGMVPYFGAGAIANAAGGPVAAGVFFSTAGGGEIYQELEDLGIDDSVSIPISMVGGLAYGLIENLQMTQAFPGLKKMGNKAIVRYAKKLTQNAAVKAAKKKIRNKILHSAFKLGGKRALKLTRGAGRYAGTVMAESFEESMQEGVKVASEHVAAALNNLKNDTEILKDASFTGDALERMTGAFTESVGPMMLMAGFGHGTYKLSKRLDKKITSHRLKKQQERLSRVHDNINQFESKYGKKHAETLLNMIENEDISLVKVAAFSPEKLNKVMSRKIAVKNGYDIDILTGTAAYEQKPVNALDQGDFSEKYQGAAEKTGGEDILEQEIVPEELENVIEQPESVIPEQEKVIEQPENDIPEQENVIEQPENDIQTPDFETMNEAEIENWFNENDDLQEQADNTGHEAAEPVSIAGFERVDTLAPVQQMNIGKLDKELESLESVIKGNPGHELELEWFNRADELAEEMSKRVELDENDDAVPEFNELESVEVPEEINEPEKFLTPVEQELSEKFNRHVERADIGDDKQAIQLKSVGDSLNIPVRFIKMGKDSLVNGFEYKGEAFINMDSDNPGLATLAHETVHVLQDRHPELWDKFKNNLKELYNSSDFEAWAAKKAGKTEELLSKKPDNETMLKELAAYLIEEQAHKEKFWKNLQDVDASLLEKILAIFKEIKNSLSKITAKDSDMQNIFGEQLDQAIKAGEDFINKANQGNQGNKPVAETLQSDAKKYDSAKDFVDSRGELLYHGTEKTLISKIEKDGLKYGKSHFGKSISITSDKEHAKSISSISAFADGKRDTDVIEVIIDKNANIYNIEKPENMATPKELRDGTADFVSKMYFGKQAIGTENQLAVREMAVENGYDGVRTGKDVYIFNNDVLKTKQQLTDIWNQAHKVEQKQPVEQKVVQKPKNTPQKVVEQSEPESKEVVQSEKKEVKIEPKKEKAEQSEPAEDYIVELDPEFKAEAEAKQKKANKDGWAQYASGLSKNHAKARIIALNKSSDDYEYKLMPGKNKDYKIERKKNDKDNNVVMFSLKNNMNENTREYLEIGELPADIPPLDSGLKVISKWLRNHYRNMPISMNKHKEWKIKITGTGIRETLNHIKQRVKSPQKELHYRTLPFIDQMLEKAKWVKDEADKRYRSDYVSKFELPVKIDGKEYRVVMIIKHYGEDKNYYDHRLTKFEELPERGVTPHKAENPLISNPSKDNNTPQSNKSQEDVNKNRAAGWAQSTGLQLPGEAFPNRSDSLQNPHGSSKGIIVDKSKDIKDNDVKLSLSDDRKQDYTDWLHERYNYLVELEHHFPNGVKPDKSKYGKKEEFTGSYIDFKNGENSDVVAHYLGMDEDDLLEKLNGLQKSDLRKQYSDDFKLQAESDKIDGMVSDLADRWDKQQQDDKAAPEWLKKAHEVHFLLDELSLDINTSNSLGAMGEKIKNYTSLMLTEKQTEQKMLEFAEMIKTNDKAALIKELQNLHYQHIRSSALGKYEKLAIETRELKKQLIDQRKTIHKKQMILYKYIRTNLPKENRSQFFGKLASLSKYKRAETVERHLMSVLEDVESHSEQIQKSHLVEKIQETFRKELQRMRNAAKLGRKSSIAYEQNVVLKEIMNHHYWGVAKHFDADKHTDMRNIHTMEKAELARVLLTIESIKQTGRSLKAYQEYELKKEIRYQADTSKLEVLEHAPKDFDQFQQALDKANKPGAIKGFYQNKKGFLDRTNMAMIAPETMIESLAGFEENSNLYKNTWEPLYNAELTKLNNLEQAKKDFEDIHKPLELEKKGRKILKKVFLELNVESPGKAGGKYVRKLTIDDLMGMYAHSKNDFSRRHLIATLLTYAPIKDGQAITALDYALEKLPQEYKDVVDRQISHYDNVQYERINDVFRRMHGVDMIKEHNYFPIQNIERRNENVLDMLSGDIERTAKNTKKGFTAERQGTSNPFKSFSYMNTVVSHMHDTEHMIALSEAVWQVKEFINNPALRKSLDHKNKFYHGFLQHWVEDVAAGRFKRPSTALTRVMEKFRLNMTSAVLGFNVKTPLKQPVSILQGWSRCKSSEIARAMAIYTASPVKTWKMIAEKDVTMRARANQLNITISKIMEDSQTERMLNAQNILPKARELGFTAIRACDKYGSGVVWLAKYNEILQKTGSEKEAIKEARRVVRLTQPQGGIINLPEAYRSNEFFRWFASFTNQLNKNYNLFYRSIKDFKGHKKQSFKTFLSFALSAAMFQIVNKGLGISTLWEEPDEAARTALNTVTGGHPVLGVISDAVARSLIAGQRKQAGYKVSPWYSYGTLEKAFIPPLAKGPLDLGQAVITAVSKGKVDARILDKSIRGMMMLFGVPGYYPVSYTFKNWDTFTETKDPRYLMMSKYSLSPTFKKKKKRKSSGRGYGRFSSRF